MKAKHSLAMVALVSFAVAGSAAFAADTPAMVDKVKAAFTPGEIVLTGSETKKIHEGSESREYRVCVKTEKEAAPMKLMYDGNEATLQPGDCKDVAGKRIDATPAQPLTGKAHIVATFDRVAK